MKPLLHLPSLWLAVLAAAPLQAAATELNLANQAELEQLKRVGPQLAQRILEDRAQHGRYADWPDFLRRLKGVGPATAQRLSEAGLRINGQAHPAQARVPPAAPVWPDPPIAPPVPQPASATP